MNRRDDWVREAEGALLRAVGLLEERMRSADDPPTLTEITKSISDIAKAVITFRAVVVADERDNAPPRRSRKPRTPKTLAGLLD